MKAPVGILANPASGKDIRRLVARASVFDNQEKRAIVARCLAGLQAFGQPEVVYFDDAHGIARGGLECAGVRGRAVARTQSGRADDTTRAAADMRSAGCGVVITLGGDGTNRAFAKGWPDAPLLPLSTGTNNVFPRIVEGTLAGLAAATVARGRVALAEVSRQAKVVHIAIEGERDDIALIDAVATNDRFVGARALLDCDRLVLAVLATATPAAVGLTSVGGLMTPVGPSEDFAAVVRFATPGRPALHRVRAPIAPGMFQEFGVASVDRLVFGARVRLSGPGVLALDGERERVLRRGQRATMEVHRDGPRVIDVERVLRSGAALGAVRTVESAEPCGNLGEEPCDAV